MAGKFVFLFPAEQFPAALGIRGAQLGEVTMARVAVEDDLAGIATCLPDGVREGHGNAVSAVIPKHHRIADRGNRIVAAGECFAGDVEIEWNGDPNSSRLPFHSRERRKVPRYLRMPVWPRE